MRINNNIISIYGGCIEEPSLSRRMILTFNNGLYCIYAFTLSMTTSNYKYILCSNNIFIHFKDESVKSIYVNKYNNKYKYILCSNNIFIHFKDESVKSIYVNKYNNKVDYSTCIQCDNKKEELCLIQFIPIFTCYRIKFIPKFTLINEMELMNSILPQDVINLIKLIIINIDIVCKDKVGSVNEKYIHLTK